jgi:integrase
VKALREGEEGTFDHTDREAVSFEVVEATMPYLLPVYQAFFRILKMTGARPSEICRMRVGDINQVDAEHWTFSPINHKTARHNKRRVIVFGAAEQAVLLPYLGKEPVRAVFSPKDAVRERKERDRAARVTPFTPSQRERDKHRAKYPKIENHEHFDSTTVGCALQNAINEANRQLPDGEAIPHWTLYQLRHAAITELVILLGEEKAAMMTGTSVEMVRRIYEHSNRKRVADMKRQAEQAKVAKTEKTETPDCKDN